MNTYQDIKQKLEAIFSQLEPMLTSLPKEVSLLFTLLLTMFHALFEMTSRQNKELREAIDNQTKTIDNQTKTINKQTRQIQTLRQTLERERREKEKFRERLGDMENQLRSKNVDIDSLNRRAFEGGSEQKKKPEPAPADADRTDASEKPAGKKKSKKRNRQSNGEKTENCDAEMNRYLTMDGDVLRAETKEEATKEIPAEIEVGGKNTDSRAGRNPARKPKS